MILRRRRSLRHSAHVVTPCLVALTLAAACSVKDPSDDDDESSGSGNASGTVAGGNSKAGTATNGGRQGSGGNANTDGGSVSRGGTAGASAGARATGGASGNGVTGGMTGMSGAGDTDGGPSGGHDGSVGGVMGDGGTSVEGGEGPGGGDSGSAGTLVVGGMGGRAGGGSAGAPSGDDPCATTTLPSAGEQHSSTNASGTAANLTWTIWSSGSGGSITTYDTAAFKAAWNDSKDFLARLGLQWDGTKTYDQYGVISAQFSSKKTGGGGAYSYIGIYGWSTDPCVEYYIVDDSYDQMPVEPSDTQHEGTATIDGGTYTLYSRYANGTGDSSCSTWRQFYSVRQTARTCGVISITRHFDAWEAAGMTLGKLHQAQILVEVGGGSGNVEFTVANVTTTM